MPSQLNTSRSPPLLDFSSFYSGDAGRKQKLVEQVRDCCQFNGFFQITNHAVPIELQQRVMAWNKKFFDLPLEEKKKVGKGAVPPPSPLLARRKRPSALTSENGADLNTWNRGYELLRSQILEEGTNPELKEGFYVGDEISKEHPYFVHQKLNSGPNVWPTEALGAEAAADFKATCLEYYYAVVQLAKDVLRVLALTLGLSESFFDDFARGAVATMRLLHYPSQPGDSDDKLTRGIGAHTDFGAITLLLQDEVDGLQVWDNDVKDWFDVVPTPNALVVNLGNLFMRWSNDRYISNVHRVINRSGRERYSIPVFFSGNPDYVIDCLPNCKPPGQPAKYPAITVEEAVSGSYRESYGRAEKFKAAQAAAAAAAAAGAQATRVEGEKAPAVAVA